MLKYNSNNKYNLINRVKYNSTKQVFLRRIISRAGNRPVVLDERYNQLGILENSFDVELKQEVKGVDEVFLKIPLQDSKRNLIYNEAHLQVFDTIYVIREIVDLKSKGITEVFAEAIFYDLQYADVLDVTEWEEATAHNIMRDILKGTGWGLGKIDFSTRRSMGLEKDANRLEGLSKVEDIFNGELNFNTQVKTVDLLKPEGEHTGAGILYDKNASDIEVIYDTKDLITKLYGYGKNDMTIEDANNGIPYVENYQYTDKVRVRSIKADEFNNPYHLKEVLIEALDELSRPRTSYTIEMGELSNRAGLEHENFFLGGVVRVFDKELGIDINARIMKWEYNVIYPERSKLTLENTVKSLSDLVTGDELTSRGVSEDSVDKSEMLDLNVFNYLLNSRADDGMSYWESRGWTVDTTKGGSGVASFKAEGAKGETKEMYQTVYPANHDSYTISFKSATESLEVMDSGRVGVEIVVRYEDGTEGTEFISLT